TTPQYAIKSSILIDETQENSTKSLLSKLETGKENTPSTNLYNEMFILKSQDLIAQIVDSLDMNIRYWTIGRVKETEVYEECPIKVVFDDNGYKGKNSSFKIRQVSEGQFEVSYNDITTKVDLDSYTDIGFGNFKIIYTSGP